MEDTIRNVIATPTHYENIIPVLIPDVTDISKKNAFVFFGFEG